MIIRRFAAENFRNIKKCDIELSDGVNVLLGDNAQGKTNLLESVYILSTGRSFRTRFDRGLVGFGFSDAEILADVTNASPSICAFSVRRR